MTSSTASSSTTATGTSGRSANSNDRDPQHVEVDHRHAVERPALGPRRDRRVEPLAVFADTGHELRGELVRFQHLQRDRVGRAMPFEYGLVQQVEGAFARIGTFVGARQRGHRVGGDQTRVM